MGARRGQLGQVASCRVVLRRVVVYICKQASSAKLRVYFIYVQLCVMCYVCESACGWWDTRSGGEVRDEGERGGEREKRREMIQQVWRGREHRR